MINFFILGFDGKLGGSKNNKIASPTIVLPGQDLNIKHSTVQLMHYLNGLAKNIVYTKKMDWF